MLVFYQNVNRVRSKINEINLNVLSNNYDIICLTETNFNDSVRDSELLDSRYNIYRRDRSSTSLSKTEGGGIVIGVKKNIEVVRQFSWESNVEDLWLTILPRISNDKKINICLCYLPPDLPRNFQQSFYDNLCTVVGNTGINEEFICIGDYNIPELSWTGAPNSLHMTSNQSNNWKPLLLLDAMAVCQLKQFNNIPNSNNHFLDLVLSSTEIRVYGADPLSRSDKHHPAIVVDVDCNVGIASSFLKPKHRQRFNFYKCNYENIKSELSLIDWHSILSCSDIDADLGKFYDIVNDIISRNTPLCKNKNSKYPIWFSPAVIRCLNKKIKFHKLYKNYGNPCDYDNFSHYRNLSKRLIKTSYQRFIASVEDSLEHDIKSFWRFVNAKKGVNQVPLSMSYCDTSSNDPSQISELFSSYFSSVFEKDSLESNFDFTDRNYNTLNSVTITEEMVLNKLNALDANKGPGPDGIPAIFIKTCSKELCEPLHILFCKSLQSGTFPTLWKIAHVVPIYKSGDKNQCQNYRPISLLSCFAKIFESIVYDTLYNHFKPYLHPQQHGFVSHRSTTSNLLEYKNFLCSAFARNVQVDSVYTDFSKAFDKVNHRALCIKLAAYGIHGSLLRWLQSYLRLRSQLVAVKGYLSTPVTVTSGVPQGSHLGPLLFVIFINDLVENLSCPCLLYADDLKIFAAIKESSDTMALQSDLYVLSNWCNKNYMQLNVDKCFVITFTRKSIVITYDYTLEGIILARKNLAKDLGVFFDSQLSFRDHYDYIIRRCSQLLGFICRITKDFRETRSFLHLYYSLIRSILEYNSAVWSPFYDVHSNRIERIQERCLKIVSYRRGMGRALTSYQERLEYFQVTSLHTRRDITNLIILYKIIHNHIDSSNLLLALNFNTHFRSRNRNYNAFNLQIYSNNTSYYNPLVRMCRQYNEILASNREIDIYLFSLFKFRRQIMEHLRNN